MPLRTRVAARVGIAVAALSRRLGRGGGSVIGGRAILALDRGAVGHLAGGRCTVLVSGTNGKTTTTSLLVAALAGAGPVTTNVLGANQPPGLAAALAGGPPGATAVLEVDEAWMEHVVPAVRPAAVVLLNLSRDQLDRNNEVRQLAARWRRTFEGCQGTLVVANADDPLVVWSASGAREVAWVGAGQPWREDAAGCPACGARIVFPDPEGEATGSTATQSGEPGSSRPAVAGPAEVASGWHCSSCELRRPALDVRLEGDEVVTADGWRRRLGLALPGRANRANAVLALTAARHLGVAPDAATEAMAGAGEVVGRYATVEIGACRARLLLAKNPAGWLEVLDVLRPAPAPLVVAINARIADGRDPSWLWDVPFERLAGRLVIASGERGRDLAVRLQYAGVDHQLVLDPVEAVRAAGAAALAQQEAARADSGVPEPEPPAPPGAAWAARVAARRAREQIGLPPAGAAAPVEIDAVGNYTSFQVLRTRLAEGAR